MSPKLGYGALVEVDIARLKARRAAELDRIAKQLRKHDDLARRLDLVLSVPGIGERTALALIIRMPELGRVSREHAAALAGLAPFDDDSGKHKGQRHIAGGRGRLRRSLYAAALPAAFRWNAALMALYARLTRPRESPQCCSHRLRQKALDLRQHRRPTRYALDLALRSEVGLTRFFVRPDGRFFVPTCRPDDAVRRRRQGWPSLRPIPNLDDTRPRLDGDQHGVTIGRVSDPPLNGCQATP